VRSPLFSQDFLGDLGLQQGFGQQFVEPGVLRLQGLEPLGIRNVHAAEFAAPEVVAGLREAMLAAQFLDWNPGICFLQETNVCSSEYRFFTSDLLGLGSDLNHRATQNRGNVGVAVRGELPKKKHSLQSAKSVYQSRQGFRTGSA